VRGSGPGALAAVDVQEGRVVADDEAAGSDDLGVGAQAWLHACGCDAVVLHEGADRIDAAGNVAVGERGDRSPSTPSSVTATASTSSPSIDFTG
jgi:hypothetical protein